MRRPLQNRHFGQKIKIPKKHVKIRFASDLELLSAKKIARKNSQYSRNETIFEIRYKAKAIALQNRHFK